MAYQYGEKSLFTPVLLPVGERRFLITEAEEYTSKKGNQVWELKLLTTFEGKSVKRTYHMTFVRGREMDVLAGLLDAVGTDPNRPEVAAAIEGMRYRPEMFVKTPALELTAYVKHEEYKGEQKDKIDALAPRILRAAWVKNIRARGYEIADQAPGLDPVAEVHGAVAEDADGMPF